EGLVDLAEVFQACDTLIAARAGQSGVRIELRLEGELPAVWADELRLKQVVLNLLTNAVKFSPRGSTVQLSAMVASDGGMRIAVPARGCGMSRDERRLALQPFRQVNSVLAKRSDGTGLGLPLSVRLVELHGGRLQLDTAPGRGTTAVVQLPPARTRAQ